MGTRAGLIGWLALGVLMFANSAPARQAVQPAQPTQQAAVAAAPRVFGSEMGFVLNFIKPDKTADFEAVVAKLKETLQKSANAQRKQQAASWKVYKSPDPGPAGSVLYVYLIDPVVKGADYTVTTILAEAFSAAELDVLYKQYTGAYATGQNFVNLALVSDLGK